ncbi:hypothetical protein HYDPIDRAFT_32460 [Hydnomerulius pinastri MD-312]|uniref:Uncharacterized protein n=1 Tax=Hydnomerulius pinastri MD-312 TaxID=994086 RepID=A0A0C9WA09_9AGAM|nr:hypothetical protein HYDPIDRAFT_32460 [Hydnomerulius pinastri MD-312]
MQSSNCSGRAGGLINSNGAHQLAKSLSDLTNPNHKIARVLRTISWTSSSYQVASRPYVLAQFVTFDFSSTNVVADILPSEAIIYQYSYPQSQQWPLLHEANRRNPLALSSRILDQRNRRGSYLELRSNAGSARYNGHLRIRRDPNTRSSSPIVHTSHRGFTQLAKFSPFPDSLKSTPTTVPSPWHVQFDGITISPPSAGSATSPTESALALIAHALFIPPHTRIHSIGHSIHFTQPTRDGTPTRPCVLIGRHAGPETLFSDVHDAILPLFPSLTPLPTSQPPAPPPPSPTRSQFKCASTSTSRMPPSSQCTLTPRLSAPSKRDHVLIPHTHSSNLTFSLSPGWAFVEPEGWRTDLEGGCAQDADSMRRGEEKKDGLARMKVCRLYP